MHPFARPHIFSYAPTWGKKLVMPHFYKPEKMEKFFRHWNHRKGLELLKQKHALQYGSTPSEADRLTMEEEIQAYVNDCYQYERMVQLKDVYVTDHSEPAKKFLTFNSNDDRSLYDYHQSLEAYNSDNQEAPLVQGKQLSESEQAL
jgi:hypothetical protein